MGGRKIRCWNCDARVSLSHGGGTCPQCGAALVPGAYHALAPLACDMAAFAEQGVTKTAHAITEIERRLRKPSLLERIPFLSPAHRLARLELERKEFVAIQAETADLLRMYAASAYYCDDWFRETRIPLPSGSSPKEAPLSHVYYDGQGVFEKIPNLTTHQGRGAYGEYLAFSLLSDALRTGRFGHARLLAHLYVPKNPKRSKRYGDDLATNEVDMALVTRFGTFVIEVKYRYCHVEASAGGPMERTMIKTWTADPDGAACGVPSEDYGPDQARRNALVLSSQGLYGLDPGSVIPVVAYAGCLSFRTRGDVGRADVIPARCSEGAYGICQAVEAEMGRRAQARKAPELSDSEIDAIADELKARFCDTNGEKRRLHLQYVAECKSKGIRARSNAPSNRRVSRAFDKELTRMIASCGMHGARAPRRRR